MPAIVGDEEQNIPAVEKPFLPVVAVARIDKRCGIAGEIAADHALGLSVSWTVLPKLRERLSVHYRPFGLLRTADVECADTFRLRELDAVVAGLCLPCKRNANLPQGALKCGGHRFTPNAQARGEAALPPASSAFPVS